MAYRTIDASPPYSILSTSNNLMNPVGIAVNYFRRGVVVVDTAQLSFQIGQVIANENLPINLPPLPDTLAVYDSIQWSTMFRTAAFPALGSTQLAYDLNFEVKNAAKLLEFLNQNERIVFFLEVVDDSTNQYLETIDSLEISHEKLSSFHGIRNIIYNSSELRNVFLRVRTVLPRQIPATYGMSELYILEGERGGENRFAIKKFDNTTATEVIPAQFVLDQNYPNPFNPTTDISFKLFNSNNVLLEVYDIQGRLVTTLVNENKTEGTYTVRWDGRNQSGVQVSTGIYFYKLNVGNSHLIKKMALTR